MTANKDKCQDRHYTILKEYKNCDYRVKQNLIRFLISTGEGNARVLASAIIQHECVNIYICLSDTGLKFIVLHIGKHKVVIIYLEECYRIRIIVTDEFIFSLLNNIDNHTRYITQMDEIIKKIEYAIDGN